MEYTTIGEQNLSLNSVKKTSSFYRKIYKVVHTEIMKNTDTEVYYNIIDNMITVNDSVDNIYFDLLAKVQFNC